MQLSRDGIMLARGCRAWSLFRFGAICENLNPRFVIVTMLPNAVGQMLSKGKTIKNKPPFSGGRDRLRVKIPQGAER